MKLSLLDRRLPAATMPETELWYSRNQELSRELSRDLGKQDWVVNLVLVDDPVMVQMNGDFRHKDGVTDVLSFSYLDPVGESNCDLATGDGFARSDLALTHTDAGQDEDPVVGELIVAPGFVSRRCLENGWPVELEFPLLLVHGLLHVLGWDHRDEDETKEMQDTEEALLARCDLAHPLRSRSES